MPSIANITVKNKANTDVVYVQKVPSAGDRSPARWTADALSTVAGFRPSFEMTTRSNGSNNGRIAEFTYWFPIVDNVTTPGKPVLLGKFPFKGSCTIPTNVEASVPDDAFVQLGNLLASTLIRQATAEGYAPT